MQQTILNSLFALNNITTEQAKVNYLQALQQPALQLFQAFRAFPVTVDYRRQDIQSVYMLRYYAPYSQVIKSILNNLHRNPGRLPFTDETFDVSFIGCGPSPEIYGFFEFLNGTAFRPQTINVHTFDIVSDHWAFSRNITFNSLIPSIWQNRNVNVVNHNFNIASHNAITPHTNAIRNSKIVVLQNCLNEIPDNLHSVVIQNLKTIISLISPNSIILIIDLFGYQPVLDLLAYFEDDTYVQANTTVLRGSRQGEQIYDGIALVNAIPPIVKTNLLTGVPYVLQNGLIARRNIRYHHLALRKN